MGISNKTSFPYPQTFHSVGIRNKISFPYPQTFHGVGIRSKTSFSYPQTFHSVGISNKTSFSYPQTFHSVGISGKTSFLYPQTIHGEAEKGYREACSCHLCPLCGGRRVQRSLILSSMPTLRRKKGTEKLDSVSCAHAAVEEGHREA